MNASPGLLDRVSAGPRRARTCRVNDVHSRLNDTEVRGVIRPRTVDDLCRTVEAAARAGTGLGICGCRHAMGGQQFASGLGLVDMSLLAGVTDIDAARGLVTVEAGIDWLRLVHHLHWTFPDAREGWGIIQKQTGADLLSIGGALAANIHGRGLRLRPLVADIESFQLVSRTGELLTCSRVENPRLFALAIGGYGLFGPIARVTLRLAPRRKVERRVAIATVEDLPRLLDERIREGCEYGDFQFATDPRSPEFLRAGVFSTYRPVPGDTPVPPAQRELSPAEWRRLLHLAHTDKARAFVDYSRYYVSTHGQIYWSDTHQLSHYPEGYHADLDRELPSRVPGSEMIAELYVPRESLPEFMASVRADARQHAVDIVYGTIRVIEPDDETVLAWARRPWACIVFNLHVDHTREGVEKARRDFRRLIDRAADLGGTYYLTYHRWATAGQVLRCHPALPAFLAEKARLDPDGLFRSDWHTHHVRLLGGAS